MSSTLSLPEFPSFLLAVLLFDDALMLATPEVVVGRGDRELRRGCRLPVDGGRGRRWRAGKRKEKAKTVGEARMGMEENGPKKRENKDGWRSKGLKKRKQNRKRRWRKKEEMNYMI